MGKGLKIQIASHSISSAYGDPYIYTNMFFYLYNLCHADVIYLASELDFV